MIIVLQMLENKQANCKCH